MRNLSLKFLPILTLAASCHSQDISSVSYTHIKNCTETVENVNAAYSELTCKKVGSYELAIMQQSPSLFDIRLTRHEKTISTEFDSVSGDLPIEPGPAIEWHLVDGEPKFMVFRLKWGTEEAPFTMDEYLVASRLDAGGFCTLATINTRKNQDANEKARLVIKNTTGSFCDSSIQKI